MVYLISIFIAMVTWKSMITIPSKTVESPLGQAFAQALGDKRAYVVTVISMHHSMKHFRVLSLISLVVGLVYGYSIHTCPYRNIRCRFIFRIFPRFCQPCVDDLTYRQFKRQNSHHQIESVFKALARALRMACEVDPRAEGMIASTKGSL